MDFGRINTDEMPPVKPPVSGTRIACILDEFSMADLEAEADFTQLSPNKWRTELESFHPHVLLIESASRGKDNVWTNLVPRCDPNVIGIIEWCKKRSIPTVFWNNDDPTHFATFLNLASHFDVILTTDLDSVPRYKQLLGNQSVYFFPFAAQTRIHNPIAKFSRADAFSFEGAYPTGHSDCTRALASFVSELSTQKPFLIFDRNFGTQGTQHADYAFPEAYDEMILGRLEPEESEYAYKAFTAGISLTPAISSQTLLPRRVYALIASGTMVVSNYSRASQTLFGDLVVTSERGRFVSQRIAALEELQHGGTKLRAQALRKILREHTYRHRVEQILEYVGLEAPGQKDRIGILSVVSDRSSLDGLIESISSQTRQPDKVVVITETAEVWRSSGPIACYSLEEVASSSINELFEGIDLLSVMDTRDFYGPHYLEDLSLAREYVASPIISKNVSQANDPGGVAPSTSYTLTDALVLRRALIDISIVEQLRVDSFLQLEARDESFCNFVIDGFEYLQDGSQANDSTKEEVQTASVAEGFALAKLQQFAAEIKTVPNESRKDDLLSLIADFPERRKALTVTREGLSLHIESTLDEGKHQYIYSKSKLKVSELPWGDSGHLYVEATTGLDFRLVVLFLDEEQERISHVTAKPSTNRAFNIPAGTRYYHFGLRAVGTGEAAVLGVYPQPYTALAVGPRTQVRKIVLTNIYPSYDDLYRNGFVHSRVRGYQEKDVDVEVVRLVNNQVPLYREYNGVRVLELNKKDLQLFIENNNIESVLVHFLSRAMYEVLSNIKPGVKVHVWVHGIEVQPWWRRKFNVTTQEELEKAKKTSETRVAMWGEIFADLPAHFDFVFVSQYFAKQVMQDYDVRLPEGKYKIIHNPIDTKLFNYEPKDVEQRKRILSIRPYASRTYANDLAVEAVQLLCSEPFFKDLEFVFIGDGPLFEETLEPLKNYENVTIERRFLTHEEIVAYHKQFGIMLIPTRMDSHGVSRDEAMSSGLVPITTDVAAVPEFVDSTCGVLAALDDAHGLAQGIKRMYENPELFQSMSAAAAARVRRQSDKDITIMHELAVFQNDNKHPG